MRRTAPVHAARTLALSALLVAGAAGCASSGPKKQVVYPPPPDKPRIAWVRSFTSEQELRTGFFQRVSRALVPRAASTVLESPTGIALTPDEKTLLVASGLRGRIIEVDRASGSMSQFGATGDSPLKFPVGLGVDQAGNVYVADKGVGAICVFDAKRKLVRFIGKGPLAAPSALAVDRRRQVLYVVNDAATAEGRHTVEVFSLAGKHLRTLGGGRSHEPSRFNFPTDVAVAPNGEVWVADMLNFRVQVFDPQGQLVKMFGQQGAGTGLFDKIHGIAFDTFGNVYIVDTMLGVQIFNDRTQPLMSFGQGLLDIPLGVVIDSKNRIFVSDYANRVHEFELVNTRAGDSHLAPPTPAGAARAPAATPSSAPRTSPATTGTPPPPAAPRPPAAPGTQPLPGAR